MPEILVHLLLTVINVSFVMSVGLFESWMVIPLLLSITMGCLYSLNLKNSMRQGLTAFYSILALFVPAFSLFMPMMTIISFDISYPLFGFFCTCVPLFHIGNDSAYLFICILSITALFLKKWLLDYQYLIGKYHLQRDTMAENALLLKQKNEYLSASKEADIQIATMDERNRISRDLHDTVGHLLSSALLQVGALEMINQQENLKEPLYNLKETLRNGIENTRKSVHDLYDTSLDLNNEIHKLTEELTQRVNYSYQLQTPISNQYKRQILAVFQEAIHNIQKHSNASLVDLHIREQPGFFQFQIYDNGTVIDSLQDGIGLNNMHKRINDMHGHLTIEKTNGFRIFFTIPKEKHL